MSTSVSASRQRSIRRARTIAIARLFRMAGVGVAVLLLRRPASRWLHPRLRRALRGCPQPAGFDHSPQGLLASAAATSRLPGAVFRCCGGACTVCGLPRPTCCDIAEEFPGAAVLLPGPAQAAFARTRCPGRGHRGIRSADQSGTGQAVLRTSGIPASPVPV